jgi:hypothetical protein
MNVPMYQLMWVLKILLRETKYHFKNSWHANTLHLAVNYFWCCQIMPNDNIVFHGIHFIQPYIYRSNYLRLANLAEWNSEVLYSGCTSSRDYEILIWPPKPVFQILFHHIISSSSNPGAKKPNYSLDMADYLNKGSI